MTTSFSTEDVDDQCQKLKNKELFEKKRDVLLKDNPLTSPLTILPDGTHIEGYWDFVNQVKQNRKKLYEKGCSQYPMPRETDKEVSKTFLAELKWVSETDAREDAYCGSSFCRLCKMCVGNREFQLGHFIYPVGIFHYYIEHGVQPSDEFHTFITQYVSKNKVTTRASSSSHRSELCKTSCDSCSKIYNTKKENRSRWFYECTL